MARKILSTNRAAPAEDDLAALRRALAAESARTETAVSPSLCRKIYEEIVGRMPATDASVPVPHDEYIYYSRQEEEQPYLIYCRKRNEVGAQEEIVLDPNVLTREKPYCSVRVMALDPSHRYLAYGLDTRGDECLELWLSDLEDPQAPARLLRHGVGASLAWFETDRCLLYTLLDDAHRPYEVWCHQQGQSPRRDQLVFHESDEAFRATVSKTESRAYLLITSKSVTTAEIRFLSADTPRRDWRVLARRRQGTRYAMTHQGDFFYVLTNQDGATNFKLMQVSVGASGQEDWRELEAHSHDVCLERLEAFAGHLVVWERRGGLSRMRVRDMTTGNSSEVSLPEEVSMIHPGDNRDYCTSRLRFGYASLTTPYSVMEYDMASGDCTVLKQTEIQGGYRQEAYESRRLKAKTRDGTEVPISLVYRRDLLGDGNPLLLYGYGAYGYPLEPEFDPARLSLLDRGVVYAIAHVRGGGELGESWHQQGRGLAKKTSFEDFIDCAEYLVGEGLGGVGRLAAMGESAGGLLVAAVVNERPDLFRAVVADCPFVDVLGALLDPSLPLTISDWEEWGDPRFPKVREYIESYSPCENVRQQAYPAVLATSAMNDPWVPVGQPARWVEQLREVNLSEHPVLFSVDPEGGHAGPSDRFKYFRETALKIAFLIEQLYGE